MARQITGVFLVLCFAVPALLAQEQTQPPAQPQSEGRQSRGSDSNRWKWWLNPDHRKELGITDAQSAQIDQIFESTMPAQRTKWREVEDLETVVKRLLKEGVADVSTVTEKVEKFEKLQAEVRANRTVMLYRMRLALTPEQRVKLDEFYKRREESRRKNERR